MHKPNDCPHKEICPLPHERMVLYRGPLEAEVVIVGQSPGVTEAEQGKPFVGPAGQLLSRLLYEAGWDESQLLFTNAVLCAPANNATPKKKQIDLCRSNVWPMLAAHPRKLIICLGNEAWSCLHSCQPKGVLNGAGTFKEHEYGTTLWSVHPAAVLRNPDLEPTLREDLESGRNFYSTGQAPSLPPLDWKLLHPDHCSCAEAVAVLAQYESQSALVIDVETTTLDPRKGALLGVGVYFPDSRQAMYLALAHGNPALSLWGEDDEWRLLKQLRGLLQSPLPKVFQNTQFDMWWLYKALGVETIAPTYDTMVEASLVDENSPRGLKERAVRHLGAPNWDALWEDSAGRNVAAYTDSAGLHLGMVPVEQVGQYCAYDCYYTWELHQFYQQHMTDRQKMLQRVLLSPQLEQLWGMKRDGLQVDVEALDRLDAELTCEITRIEGQVNELCGTSGLNLNSVPQKRHLLYSMLGLGNFVPKDPQYLTETGQLSTNADTLNYLLELDWIEPQAQQVLTALLRHSALGKIKSAFIKNLYEHMDGKQHVHAEYTQATTVTGRLSCKSPNLQQQPKYLRPLFVAPAGYSFVEADYAQAEVRVWAELSGDPVLRRVIVEVGDLHSFNMSQALSKPMEAVTEEERGWGKVLLFAGVMYGGGAHAVSKKTGIGMAVAEAMLETMTHNFAQGMLWMDAQVEFCRKHGYVQSPLGRIRRLAAIHSPDQYLRLEAERQAYNSVIQGVASDITGIAALRVARAWQAAELDARVAVLVHDAIVGIVRNDQLEEAQAIMQQEMIRPPYKGWTTPLEAETEAYPRWGGELDYAKILHKEPDEDEQ